MQLLDEKQGENIWRFLQSINEYVVCHLFHVLSQLEFLVSGIWMLIWTPGTCRRHDLTDSLRKLQCRTLIFVGENSAFHEDAIHMTAKLDRKYCALVEVI
jgi:hypothetical protein